MVKLIRLASNNNCKFNADLDQGIKLGENSQIALQNITFDTEDFTTLSISADRNEVSFNLNTTASGDVSALSETTALLKTANYNLTTITDFYDDLESKMNMCCKSTASNNDNIYHSFFVVYDAKTGYEFAMIEGVYMFFKLNPMSMMFNFNHDGKPREGNRILFASSENSAGTANLALNTTYNGSNGLDLGNIRLRATLTATADHKYYIYPTDRETRWSRGSGMYMVRIHDLVDNTGTADTNGFAVGLSFTDISVATNGGIDTDMTDAMRDFELRVTRPLDDFQFVEPSNPNTNQTSTGNAPFKFSKTTTPDQLEHDLILFEKEGKVVTCKVIDTSVAGGNSTTIFTYTMTDAEHEKDLYPYVIVYAQPAHCEVGLPVLTLDNNINPMNLQFKENGNDPVDNDEYGIVGQAQALYTLGDDNIYEVYKTNHGNGFINNGDGFVNDDAFDKDADPDILADYTPNLKMHSRIVQNLGFNVKGSFQYTFGLPKTELSNGVSPYGQFNLEPDSDILTVNSDNYIVVLDSQPLKSYDASEYDYSANPNAINQNNNTTKRGRQKSILATIPANNNGANGIVEFQPNELVYIDLDNKFDLELKNLRLRVLNKQFGEIRTTGTSIMTLLFKD